MIECQAGQMTVHRIDVGDRSQVYQFADQVLACHSQIDLVINNAAVMVFDSIEDVTYDDFEWVMGINFWGVVYGTKAFLPHLKKRPEGHIVNMSSINCMVTTPNNGPYCISRFAVQGFSETLSQELQDSSVKVSCVIPGGVKTNIVRNTRFVKQANCALTRDQTIEWFDRASLTSPEKAARTIIRGIKKNRGRILVGPDAYVIDLMRRLMPQSTTRYAGRKIGKLKPKKRLWSP